MVNVNIKFNGKDYLLSCDEGQEDNLKELADFLDNKYLELKNNLGNIGESKLLLITTIKIIDEFFDIKKKVNIKKEEFENLSKKFKELKSLVYEYKDKKEEEIKNLTLEQNNFRQEIQKNKEDYEKIIENAAEQIEDFVKKSNSENSIQ